MYYFFRHFHGNLTAASIHSRDRKDPRGTMSLQTRLTTDTVSGPALYSAIRRLIDQMYYFFRHFHGNLTAASTHSRDRKDPRGTMSLQTGLTTDTVSGPALYSAIRRLADTIVLLFSESRKIRSGIRLI